MQGTEPLDRISLDCSVGLEAKIACEGRMVAVVR